MTILSCWSYCTDNHTDITRLTRLPASLLWRFIRFLGNNIIIQNISSVNKNSVTECAPGFDRTRIRIWILKQIWNHDGRIRFFFSDDRIFIKRNQDTENKVFYPKNYDTEAGANILRLFNTHLLSRKFLFSIMCCCLISPFFLTSLRSGASRNFRANFNPNFKLSL